MNEGSKTVQHRGRCPYAGARDNETIYGFHCRSRREAQYGRKGCRKVRVAAGRGHGLFDRRLLRNARGCRRAVGDGCRHRPARGRVGRGDQHVPGDRGGGHRLRLTAPQGRRPADLGDRRRGAGAVGDVRFVQPRPRDCRVHCPGRCHRLGLAGGEKPPRRLAATARRGVLSALSCRLDRRAGDVAVGAEDQQSLASGRSTLPRPLQS